MIFENFYIPALYMTNQAVLALYASGSGRSTGVVVNCGHTECNVVPIYEGHVLPHAITTLKIGGNDLTSKLMIVYAFYQNT